MTKVAKLYQKLGIILKTFPVDENYCNIAKILIAAAYSGKAKANATINLVQRDLVQESAELLHGDNLEPIGVGIDPSESTAEKPKFEDTKKKAVAVGSLTSMLFWSQDQVTFLTNDHPRTVVYGQYGCGKTILIVDKMRRYLRRVKKMNEEICEDNEEVSVEKPRALFISCLNPSMKNSRDELGRFIEPIFDTTLKVALDEMAQSEGYEILFENAESVCKKMKVRLSRSNFYSKLPEFLEGKVSQFQM